MPLTRSKLARKPLKRKSSTKSRLKPKTLTKLQTEADSVYSKSLRKEYADENGMVKCYTCGAVFPIAKIQCGHYISRFYKIVRFDKRNTKPQCMMCNLWKRGDSPTFRENLVLELGEETVKELEALRKQPFKVTREFYEEIITRYASGT